MESTTFDRLRRLFARSGTRRAALSALLGTAVLSSAFRSVAAKGKHQAKGKRRGKGGGKGRKGLGAQEKPGREVTDLADDFTLDTCGFPVQIHQEGTAIALDFGDHLLFAAPGATWTLTNPANGASTRVVIPGPEFVAFNADGTVTVRGSGPWAWGRRHPVTEEPGIWLTIGRFVWLFDAERNLLSAEFAGRSQNLCVALA